MWWCLCAYYVAGIATEVSKTGDMQPFEWIWQKASSDVMHI